MMKNKKLFCGVLTICVLAIIGIGLFLYLRKPTTQPPTTTTQPPTTTTQPPTTTTQPPTTTTQPPKGQVIIKQSGGASMLIAECGDRNYITNTADYIIEGTVEKAESKWNEENTLIFTYTDLSIEKYVKGTPLAEGDFQIVTPGGTVGKITQWVEEQPIFHEGKKVRIYFQETNGEFSIVCGHMGVEEI